MPEYKIETVNPYFRNRRMPAALLHFTAGFLLLNAYVETSATPGWKTFSYFFLGLALFELVYTFFSMRLLLRRPWLNTFIRLLAAIAFLLYGIQSLQFHHTLMGIFMAIIAATFVLIGFIEKRRAAPFIIRITTEGVWFPRLFKDELLAWNRLNNVILRHDVLTLDFTNNRVLQCSVKGRYSPAEQEEVNDFSAKCKM